MEKTQQEKREIHTIKDDENNILEEKNEILTEIKQYYTKLYKTEYTNHQQIHKNLEYITNKLTDKESNELNKTIKSKEIKDAIKAMKNKKTPGEDGLNKEFYLTFYDFLEEELTEILNSCMLQGEIPKSQKNTIIKRGL